MNKRILGGLAAAVMLTGGLAIMSAGVVSANNGTSELCPDGTGGYGLKTDTVNDPATVSYTAPEGFLVAGYCVKAGTTIQEPTFDPPEKSVVIDHTLVDSVSHYSVKLVPEPQDEPTVVPPPVLSASYDCVADSASSLLNPVSSTKWTAGPITEDKSTDTFTVEITPAEGSQFADSEGSITLTAEYIETSDCEATVAVPSLTPPSCQAAGSVVAVNTAKYTFGNVGNNYTATAVAGVRLVGQTVFGMQPLPKLNTGCSEVTQSEPPIAPVAPAIRPAPDAVAAFSPAQAPPAEVSALPSVLPAQALPSTGIDGTGITAIIALLLTSLGGAALFLSRRFDVTN